MGHVGIIGGGIIGLSSAYYLNKAGFQVTVFDQGDLKDGCSFGNAGMVVPSHVIPLASPGMISRGIRWMFNSSSPFYVRPRFSGELIRWGYQFYKHTTKENVERSIPALKEISLFSKAIYQEWSKVLPFDFGYQERGLMMLFQKEETEREEMEAVHQLHKAGVEAHFLTLSEIQKMEPDVRVSARGGVYYPGDAHLVPQKLMENLISYLKGKGVMFKSGTVITGFQKSVNSVQGLKTNQGDFEIDELVVATGSWSGTILFMLGISLPMQAGKGYSFTIPEVEKNIRIPSIFLEARVSVTPLGSALRFGGTMEISGVNHNINMRRVNGIVNAIPNYYPDMKVAMPAVENVWHGLRPCSPDGLPYIGRARKFKNVIIATGHAMMGLSLGPGTGKLVAELMKKEQTSIPILTFNPERFG